MKLKSLFKKEISRRINPAVVVSEMDIESVQQEIEEYIFTNDIVQNLHKFLNAITQDKVTKTGIWISGYYGSGKSHFIKYLFYCLNKSYRANAINRYLEAVKNINEKESFPEVILNEARLVTDSLEKFTVEEIIFNIDVVSGEKDKDAITNVLFNQFNKFRGYNDNNIPLALFIEKQLDRKGLFQVFQEKIKEKFEYDWKGNEFRFVNQSLANVIEVAKELDDTLDPESLRNAILNPPEYRIKDLINEFQEFLADKPSTYRLVFLLDEVSQYIGSNTSLLLNLQSIIEEISTYCQSKIWIACTAQQDLSSLIENRDNKTEDFGKILGRFDTMISLQSQDAAYITKKRVLDKNDDGKQELIDYYRTNKVAIDNQFVVVHDLYKSYSKREDFLLTYPFIPYQFQLITDVFTAFSRAKYVTEGVRDSERSILGITHFTAQQCMEQEVGYFVPFDLFFNEQLVKNLTHHANNIISRAYKIEEVFSDPFAKRVVNILFMLSSLSESQQVNFPATIENIAHLLMSNIEDTKLDLQTKTEVVLSKLVEKKIIQESDNTYRFYKEDEIEVANMIDSININSKEQSEALDSILNNAIGKPQVRYSFGNNKFTVAAKIDDLAVKNIGDLNVQFLFFDTRKAEDIMLNVARQDLIVCCNEWFTQDKSLIKDLTKYVKTDNYIKQYYSNAQGKRKNTIQNFRVEADKLKDKIAQAFKIKFSQTRFISAQNIIEAESISRSGADNILDAIIIKHIEEIYHKNELTKHYVDNQSNLRLKADDRQQTIDKSLTPAEEAIENYLNMQSEGISVSDVVKDFAKIPYGWKDISTLHVLIELNKKDKRRFEFNNNPIAAKDFAVQAINTQNRMKISIYPQKGYSVVDIANFINAVNNIAFSENIIPTNLQDFKLAIEKFKEQLKSKLKEANELKGNYEGYPLNIHFKNYHSKISNLYNERNDDKIFDLMLNKANDYAAIRDKYVQAKEFVEDRFDSVTSFKNFVNKHAGNFNTLDEVDKVKSQRLKEYLQSDSEPWTHFPEMRKIHKHLNKALEAKVAELQKEAIEKYQSVFDELQKQEGSLGLSGIVPNPETYFNQLKGMQTISELQLEIRDVNKFRANQTKRLYDAIPKPPVAPKEPTKVEQSEDSIPTENPTPYVPAKATIYTVNDDDDLLKEIKSEEELNDYINTLRAKMLKMLKENKIIILQ